MTRLDNIRVARAVAAQRGGGRSGAEVVGAEMKVFDRLAELYAEMAADAHAAMRPFDESEVWPISRAGAEGECRGDENRNQ